MFKVYLILGANLGAKERNLLKAINLIGARIGRVIKTSSIYETAAWGNTHQPDFFNIALIAETTLEPLKVLEEIHGIEALLGRKREEHWGARTMDIDIAFYEDQIISLSNLKIPHPFIAKRKFVLAPFLEIIPNFEHPLLKKSIQDLYLNCDDNTGVKKYS